MHNIIASSNLIKLNQVIKLYIELNYISLELEKNLSVMIASSRQLLRTTAIKIMK